MSDGLLRAHSCILMAGSDAIRGMLRNGIAATSSQKRLSWKEHPLSVGRFFLRLLYSGTVDESEWGECDQEARSCREVPLTIEVKSPNGQKFCTGLYELVEGSRPNGKPLWKKSGQPERWLYCYRGVWNVCGKDICDENFETDAGYIFSAHKDDVASPDLVSCWRRFDDHSLDTHMVDNEIFVGETEPQVPLRLLLGSLVIAKVYFFPCLVSVLVQTMKSRLSCQTFDMICGTAVKADVTSLRFHCVQYAKENEKTLSPLYNSSRFAPEVLTYYVEYFEPVHRFQPSVGHSGASSKTAQTLTCRNLKTDATTYITGHIQRYLALCKMKQEASNVQSPAGRPRLSSEEESIAHQLAMKTLLKEIERLPGYVNMQNDDMCCYLCDSKASSLEGMLKHLEGKVHKKMCRRFGEPELFLATCVLSNERTSLLNAGSLCPIERKEVDYWLGLGPLAKQQLPQEELQKQSELQWPEDDIEEPLPTETAPDEVTAQAWGGWSGRAKLTSKAPFQPPEEVKVLAANCRVDVPDDAEEPSSFLCLELGEQVRVLEENDEWVFGQSGGRRGFVLRAALCEVSTSSSSKLPPWKRKKLGTASAAAATIPDAHQVSAPCKSVDTTTERRVIALASVRKPPPEYTPQNFLAFGAGDELIVRHEEPDWVWARLLGGAGESKEGWAPSSALALGAFRACCCLQAGHGSE
ncbi:unnamed protein product [Polarella glacialis]|uniref:SH3 domain-containing protein n=1 Tax=Polarella glacialis TaxID=89957 RepID=A0A813K1Z6_POLGL|nr:unnamed protein product [Polarella glacialis]